MSRSFMLIIVYTILSFGLIAHAATDRQQVLEASKKTTGWLNDEGREHCVITYADDGTETKTCQDMKDALVPTGLIFNCKAVTKRLVCNHRQ